LVQADRASTNPENIAPVAIARFKTSSSTTVWHPAKRIKGSRIPLRRKE
jgi:hypothetical protein